MNTIYANVLLSDGKILFWYTGDKCEDYTDFYKDFYFAGINMSEYAETHRLKVSRIGFNIESCGESFGNFVFGVLAKKFYEQYPISEDSRGEKPY